MVVEIPVSGGHVAWVDEEDAPRVLAHRWHRHPPNARSRKTYAFARIERRTVYMHRLVLGAGKGQEVDHANGDGLDNRRANLRLATRSLNEANKPKPRVASTSRFKGVHLTRSGKWRARLMLNKKGLDLGTHASEVDAALAYDRAALATWGEFALLNFPQTRQDAPQRPATVASA